MKYENNKIDEYKNEYDEYQKLNYGIKSEIK